MLALALAGSGQRVRGPVAFDLCRWSARLQSLGGGASFGGCREREGGCIRSGNTNVGRKYSHSVLLQHALQTSNHSNGDYIRKCKPGKNHCCKHSLGNRIRITPHPGQLLVEIRAKNDCHVRGPGHACMADAHDTCMCPRLYHCTFTFPATVIHFHQDAPVLVMRGRKNAPPTTTTATAMPKRSSVKAVGVGACLYEINWRIQRVIECISGGGGGGVWGESVCPFPRSVLLLADHTLQGVAVAQLTLSGSPALAGGHVTLATLTRGHQVILTPSGDTTFTCHWCDRLLEMHLRGLLEGEDPCKNCIK